MAKTGSTRNVRTVLFLAFIAFTSGAKAQGSKRESACDTVVFGHHYARCVVDRKHRPIIFGNRNEAGERHGWWCELKDTGARNEGEYRNGHKVGPWAMGDAEIWMYDNNGTLIKKGKACRDCPAF